MNRLHNQRGVTYLMVMAAIVLMGVAMTFVGQQWSVMVKRDKEAELLFRGNRIKNAIEAYAAGNLTGVTDLDSALTMTYDLANRLTSVLTAGSSNQPAVKLSYTYDKTGNRLTLTDPTGANSYAYDALNRLTTLTSPVGATSYAYDALSRRTSATLPNGTQTTYSYDPASQVTNICTSSRPPARRSTKPTTSTTASGIARV